MCGSILLVSRVAIMINRLPRGGREAVISNCFREWLANQASPCSRHHQQRNADCHQNGRTSQKPLLSARGCTCHNRGPRACGQPHMTDGQWLLASGLTVITCTLVYAMQRTDGSARSHAVSLIRAHHLSILAQVLPFFPLLAVFSR